MKSLLIVVVFILIISFLNNFVFAENEFSIDTLLKKSVKSLSYNSDNGNIYAALFPDQIAVINSTTNNITDIIRNLEIFSDRIDYDPVNSALYVFGEPLGLVSTNISVIDNKNDNISKTFTIYKDSDSSLGSITTEIAFNSKNKSIYAINFWNNSLFVINASSYKVIKNIPIEGDPTDLLYNPSNNYLYVSAFHGGAGSNSSVVYIIDPLTYKVIENIPIKGDLLHLSYNPSNDYVYATNLLNNTGNVGVIDSYTNEVIKNIPIGEFSKQQQYASGTLTYNPSNGYVYVALNNSISLINSNNEIVKNISFKNIGTPSLMEYDPNNFDLYVVLLNNKKIAVIDSTTNKVTDIIENLQGYPSGIAYNPENKNLNVLQTVLKDPFRILNHTVYVINSTTNNVTDIVENLQGYPSGIAYNPENKNMNLFIENITPPQDKLRLLKINPATNNVTDIIENLQEYPSGSRYTFPSGIVYNPENKQVYMSDILNKGAISVIDPSTNEVIKNIQIRDAESSLDDLLYNPSNGYIYYVTNLLNHTRIVAVIDSSTNEVIKNILIGETNYDSDLLYNPSNDYVYVTNLLNHTGNVAVIDSSTNEVIKNIPIGEGNYYPIKIIYNPSNGHLYVQTLYSVDKGEYNYVTVIDPSTNEVIKNIPVGETSSSDDDLLYNPSNNYIYVTSIIDNKITVSIIDPSTNNVTTNISIGYPVSGEDRNLLYNPSNGYVYLNSEYVYIIKDK